MEATQSVCISVIATEHVSLFEWHGPTRIQVTEARGSTAELSNVDTDELLRSFKYLVGRLVRETERTDIQTRILDEIAKELAELKPVQAAA